MTKTEISNLALGNLGIGVEIANFDTEDSEPAAACRRFYTTALKWTFRSADWPFARKFATLGLIEEDPNDEWGYSYTYPADCLHLRKILSGVRTDNRQSRVEFEIAHNDSGKIIFTDQDDAECKYTRFVEDGGIYPHDFILAFSFQLAGLIAPTVTSQNRFELQEKMFKNARAFIAQAWANAMNEEQPAELPDAEWIRAHTTGG